MAKSVRKPRVPVAGAGGPLRQPLAGLAELRDRLPAPASPGPEAPPPPSAPPDAKSIYARSPRVVVRRERKGHGGKVVTRIEGLVGSPREIEVAVREIRRSLGCGAALEGADVVVQGAQGDRLVRFLESRGVRKVVVAS